MLDPEQTPPSEASINVTCGCGRAFAVPSRFAGRLLRCRHCDAETRVPAPASGGRVRQTLARAAGAVGGAWRALAAARARQETNDRESEDAARRRMNERDRAREERALRRFREATGYTGPSGAAELRAYATWNRSNFARGGGLEGVRGAKRRSRRSPARHEASTGSAASTGAPSTAATGVAYERTCAAGLRDAGWGVEHTSASGDQGADLLATRVVDGRRVRVAVQCKCYGKPVGNGAVQEVIAARAFYGTDYAAVVAPNGFTPAATALADRAGVVLLRDASIGRLLELLRARRA